MAKAAKHTDAAPPLIEPVMHFSTPSMDNLFDITPTTLLNILPLIY
jgi:hypothetical protein